MEGSRSGYGSRSVQTIADPYPGGPKTYESYGSGSTTLLKMNKNRVKQGSPSINPSVLIKDDDGIKTTNHYALPVYNIVHRCNGIANNFSSLNDD